MFIKYIIHGSKNCLLYDLIYFENVALVDTFLLQSKSNHTIS